MLMWGKDSDSFWIYAKLYDVVCEENCLAMFVDGLILFLFIENMLLENWGRAVA